MPDGWRLTTVGEVAEVNPRDKPLSPSAPFVPMDAVEPGARWPRYYDERGSRGGARFQSGDVLMARITPCLENGKVAQIPVDVESGGGSTEFVVLRAGPLIDPDFLYAWASWRATIDAATALMVGTSGRQRVAAQDIAQLPFALPPLVVQRRVVDLVDAVDTYATAAARSSESSSTHLAALCEAVFEVDAPMMAMTDLAVPKGLIGGPFGSSLVAKDYVDEGVPVIRGTNMPKAGCFVGGEFAHVSPEKADQLRRNLAAPGDVVFTQRGTLGQVGLVPAAGPDRYVVSQSQMRLRPNPDLVLGEYVFLVFRSPRMVAEVLGRNTATANPHINLGILAGLEIPVPALAEQAAIVELAWSSMAVAERAEDLRRDVQRLRSALLDELLSGECEIPGSYDELVGLVA